MNKSHYNFEDLYKTQTMLDEQFLINEVGFDLEELQPFEKNIIFKNYYLDICTAIYQLHFKKYKREAIEAKLDTDYKKYTFLMAQARQLFLDRSLGLFAVTMKAEGNKDGRIVHKDTEVLLDMLGFINNGTLFK